jgi:hypothetical protein
MRQMPIADPGSLRIVLTAFEACDRAFFKDNDTTVKYHVSRCRFLAILRP